MEKPEESNASKKVAPSPDVNVNPKNPLGLGDPEDQRLRKVEKEILIPMKMRDKAKTEKCTDLVAAFSKCCKNSSVAMVVMCRDENTKMKACLSQWYQNEDFRQECQEEYLRERSEYRRTGIKQKAKKYEA